MSKNNKGRGRLHSKGAGVRYAKKLEKSEAYDLGETDMKKAKKVKKESELKREPKERKQVQGCPVVIDLDELEEEQRAYRRDERATIDLDRLAEEMENDKTA